MRDSFQIFLAKKKTPKKTANTKMFTATVRRALITCKADRPGGSSRLFSSTTARQADFAHVVS